MHSYIGFQTEDKQKASFLLLSHDYVPSVYVTSFARCHYCLAKPKQLQQNFKNTILTNSVKMVFSPISSILNGCEGVFTIQTHFHQRTG